MRHEGGSLRRRNSSTTDGTCTPRPKTAIGKQYRSAPVATESRLRRFWPRSLFCLFAARAANRCLGKQFHQLSRQGRKIRRGCRAARMNYNVPSRSNLLSMQSYNFPQPAPYAVSPHGISQTLFDAPAESAQIKIIRTKECGKLTAGAPPPLAIYRVVFGAVHQTTRARKAEPRPIRRA